MRLVVKSAILIAAMSFSFFSHAQQMQFFPSQNVQQYYTNYVFKEYPKIQFEVDYQRAFQKSLQSKKPILMYYTGGYSCGPCITLKNTLLKDQRYANFINTHFIPFLVNSSHIPEEFATQPPAIQAQTKKLLIQIGLPSFVIPNNKNYKKGANVDIFLKWTNSVEGEQLDEFLLRAKQQWDRS